MVMPIETKALPIGCGSPSGLLFKNYGRIGAEPRAAVALSVSQFLRTNRSGETELELLFFRSDLHQTEAKTGQCDSQMENLSLVVALFRHSDYPLVVNAWGQVKVALLRRETEVWLRDYWLLNRWVLR